MRVLAVALAMLALAVWPGEVLAQATRPNGIQERLNSERFPFERDQPIQADLKFRLLDVFGPLLYCDPDYPVARADEQSLALARFPQIQTDALTYPAILAREHLDP